MRSKLAVFVALILVGGYGTMTAGAPGTEPYRRLSAGDRALVERVVMAEARGEPFRGMKAVAQVILQRLESPVWPDSLEAVIQEPGQFARPWAGEVSRAVRQAVHEVFDRGLLAIQGEVLYFMNPTTASRAGKAWQDRNTDLVQVIGRHQFRR